MSIPDTYRTSTLLERVTCPDCGASWMVECYVDGSGCMVALSASAYTCRECGGEA